MFDLGSASGVVDFSFDAYGVPDAFTVRYEGQVVFETGCSPHGGTERIAFAGSATTFEVQVDLCAVGSEYEYAVGCPCKVGDPTGADACRCQAGELLCGNGLCVPAFARCNGEPDCQGGDDELGCP